MEKKSKHSSKLDFKNCYLARQTFMPDSKSRLKPTSPNNQKDPTVIYGLFRPVPELGSPPFCIVLLIRLPIFGHKLFTQGGGILIPSALHKVQTTAPTFYDLVKVFGRNIPVIGNESSGRRKNLTTYTCSKQRTMVLAL